jgi:hypothetical protein
MLDYILRTGLLLFEGSLRQNGLERRCSLGLKAVTVSEEYQNRIETSAWFWMRGFELEKLQLFILQQLSPFAKNQFVGGTWQNVFIFLRNIYLHLRQ